MLKRLSLVCYLKFGLRANQRLYDLAKTTLVFKSQTIKLPGGVVGLIGAATSRSLVNRGYHSAHVRIRMLNICVCHYL